MEGVKEGVTLLFWLYFFSDATLVLFRRFPAYLPASQPDRQTDMREQSCESLYPSVSLSLSLYPPGPLRA